MLLIFFYSKESLLYLFIAQKTKYLRYRAFTKLEEFESRDYKSFLNCYLYRDTHNKGFIGPGPTCSC